VNIGIGGSDLGPVMAYEALRSYSDRDLTLRFVSNIDGTDFAEATRDLDRPRHCYRLVQAFTTLETMTNAETARSWLLATLGRQTAVASTSSQWSTNADAVDRVRIDPMNMFGFWTGSAGGFDGLGHRLSTMLAVGPDIPGDAPGFHAMG